MNTPTPTPTPTEEGRAVALNPQTSAALEGLRVGLKAEQSTWLAYADAACATRADTRELSEAYRIASAAAEEARVALCRDLLGLPV